MTETVEEIVRACESMAGLPYDGEPVDQLEHAMQCAELAQSERGGDIEFVVACLLHDIARAPAVAGIPYDGPREHHGEAGGRWLEPRAGARVARLAAQHVSAKRFLVATDARYRELLSDVSRRTLEAQGGAMSTAEIEEFRSRPDWRQAVELRLIDDRAKVPGLAVPGIEAYGPQLATVVAAAQARPPQAD